MQWRGRIYMEHEWDDFAEDNVIAEGDTMFFTYIVESSMKVVIFRNQ
jgi:hypothetical protein